jgi:hypothetical protein
MDRGSITNPAKMTPDERRDYVDTYPCVEELFSCVRGHDGCSISHGGPCLDDVLRYMEAHGEMDIVRAER